jgi:hypothetical protein
MATHTKWLLPFGGKDMEVRKADNISLKLVKDNLLISRMGYSVHFDKLAFETNAVHHRE